MNPVLSIERTNTILYCERWSPTVAFYRDTLGLAVTHATDWFVEVHLSGTAHLSIADAARTTISPAHGTGITLSWQTADLPAGRDALIERGVVVSDIATRWDSEYIDFHDPEGTRIELWSSTRW